MSKKRMIDSIVCFLCVFLFSSFSIFYAHSFGRYVFLGCSLATFILYAVKKNGKIKVRIESYQVFIGLLATYSLLSTMWAISTQDAIQKAFTLYQMLFVFSLIYFYYREDLGVRKLLGIVKYSSVVIAGYIILYYGISNVFSLLSGGGRIESVVINSNAMGLVASIGLLIALDEILTVKKPRLEDALMVPTVVLLIVSQSRTAIVSFIVGCVFLVSIKLLDRRNFANSFFKIFVAIIVLMVMLYFVLQLPAFNGLMERIHSMLNMFTGKGAADGSTTIRSRMIKIGIEQFCEKPILGIGMGCSHLLALEGVGRDYYLHNNFVELLSGGGIIGFALYYSAYLYFFRHFLKCRKMMKDDGEYCICATLCVVFLLSDYGHVSYITKEMNFYMMILFLEVKKLKRRQKSKNDLLLD